MQSAQSRFSRVAMTFHWLIAALIVCQYVLAKFADLAAQQSRLVDQLAILANHKSVGLSILVLALARLVYRLFSAPPPLPEDFPYWQRVLSGISHWLLYGFLFALPLSGWLMSSAKAYSVSWFGLFTFPDLIVAEEALALQLVLIHRFLADALFVVALIHILAALKHRFIDQDQVLQRMADAPGWWMFSFVVIFTVTGFGRIFTDDPEEASRQLGTSSTQSISASNLAVWKIDYEDSFIKFSTMQAGAPFTGEWNEWKANIQFDPDQLEQGRFDVSVNVNSVFTNDKDRDDTIKSADFFDVEVFPSSSYLAEKFHLDGDGFVAEGQLIMKGYSGSVPLNFSVVNQGSRQILTGKAKVDRLAWNLGTGDWADPSWVGQNVAVEVRVARILPDQGSQ